jgi:hypothetical protein
MKTKLFAVALLIAPLCCSLLAGTPEQDKAFVDKYKAAFEKGDKATLESFLYTKDATDITAVLLKELNKDAPAESKPSPEDSTPPLTFPKRRDTVELVATELTPSRNRAQWAMLPPPIRMGWQI